MADFGLTLYLANKILNHLTGNGTWTPPSALYAQLHIGPMGASGTSSISAGSATRVLASYGPSTSNGAFLTSGLGPWTNGGVTETILGISFWDASTSGNCLWGAPLPAPRTWSSGAVEIFTTATPSFNPLAA